MPINFFDDRCKQESNRLVFGVCDDAGNTPAYLDENNRAKWIAKVNNPENKTVEFYAIDNCVEIRKPDGNQDKRCDGILRESRNLCFIELKQRKAGRWFRDGREQLARTIEVFKENHDINEYSNVTAVISNSLKPLSRSSKAIDLEKFRNQTGYILRDSYDISI